MFLSYTAGKYEKNRGVSAKWVQSISLSTALKSLQMEVIGGYLSYLLNYGRWNVAKVEIFVICFISTIYELLVLLYISYLCYMFIIYL